MIYLEGRKQDVDALTFSPDGKLLAVGGSASHVQLWDLGTRTVRKMLGPRGPHRAVAFLPGGVLMTATPGPCVRVAPLDGSGPVREYFGPREGGHRHLVQAVAVGDQIVICGQYNYGPLLEGVSLPLLTYRWQRVSRAVVGDQPYRLCPCPDGLLVVGTDHGTYLFDPVKSEKVRDIGWHLNFVPAVAVSGDGKMLAVAAGMDLVLHDLARSSRLAATRSAGRKQLTDVAFHPSGRFLLASSNNQTVRVYDLALAELASFDWEVGPVRRVAFSPDGMTAAAAGKTGRVVLWDFDL
jgi:WD40 repeat protein